MPGAGTEGPPVGRLEAVSLVDWIALGIIVSTAVGGVRRGLVTGVLSLGGLVAGAIVGARAVPGDRRRARRLDTPRRALRGCVRGDPRSVDRALRRSYGAEVDPAVAAAAHSRLRRGRPARRRDGLALCWVVGATLLYAPGQSDLRRFAQESSILSGLTEALPPERVMMPGRIDSFAAIAGPATGVAAPDPPIAHVPEIAARATRLSACGGSLAASGSRARMDRAPRVGRDECACRRRIEAPVIDRRDGRLTRRRSSRSMRATTSRSSRPRPERAGAPPRRSRAGKNGCDLGFPLDGRTS